MLIDSHCHIYADQFDKDRDEVIHRAEEAGVKRIFMPNIDKDSIDPMLEAELRYGDRCIPMIGLHPCSVNRHFEKELYVMEEWLNRRKFAAIGEIGTDLHWDKTWWDQQQEALKLQLQWALDRSYPVVLHCRDSIGETIEIIRPFAEEGLKGVFHCFTGTIEQAQEIVAMNFTLGMGGVTTFKNGGMEEVICNLPLESFLLETDSPYLAPSPYRGKRNEPAFTRLVAERIAELREDDLSEVTSITTATTEAMFHGV